MGLRRHRRVPNVGPWAFAAGDVRAGSTKQLGAATDEGMGALLAVRPFLEEERTTQQLLTAV